MTQNKTTEICSMIQPQPMIYVLPQNLGKFMLMVLRPPNLEEIPVNVLILLLRFQKLFFGGRN